MINLSTLLLLILSVLSVAVSAKVRGSKDTIDDQSRRLIARNLADYPVHHLGGEHLQIRNLKNKRKGKKGKKGKKKNDDYDGNDGNDDDEVMCFKSCDPAGVNLADFPQWEQEEGYWIGEYTLYQSDGTPFTSPNWNYRYDAYRGFITGNVQGNAYRQRNVFFYPPQFAQACETDSSVQGNGTCGVNGNTKVFEADQSATTCSTNPELGGDIQGPFAGVFETFTELIGQDNALLYQVYLFGSLFQSQLTTLSVDEETGQVRRTRSAQSFQGGLPATMSFYRERKVSKETFYAEMATTIMDYNILTSDVCTWVDNPTFDPPVIATDLTPGTDGCMQHLEESFEL